MEYRNLSTETLDLCSTQWKLAQKGQESYVALQTTPPTFPYKKAQIGAAVKTCISASHIVKRYADDLSVLSSSAQHHMLLHYQRPSVFDENIMDH